MDLDNAVIVGSRGKRSFQWKDRPENETTAPIRQAEVGAALDMLHRTQARTGLYPERFVGDGAYGDAETLGWLVHEKGIEPHVPVLDKTRRKDGTFSRADFTFDPGEDRYICPGDKELLPHRRPFQTIRPKPKDDETVQYRAAKPDCTGCPCKPRCCPNTPARKITRWIHEGARDLAREIAKTDAFVASRRARRKVEMVRACPRTNGGRRPSLAHMKKILGLDRLRLRGPNGAKDEFIFAATAQNLRKMAKLLPATA